MKMTRSDVGKLLALRQTLWPHTPLHPDPNSEIDVWLSLFDGHAPEVVAAAMRERRGDAFPPTPGQLEETINPSPSWASAWDEFTRMVRRYSTQYVSASDVPWSDERIKAFAEGGWWMQFGSIPDETYNPSAHAAARAHFREAFQSFQTRAIGERLTGIAAAVAAREELERGKVVEIGDGRA